MLRYRSPLQWVMRTPRRDVELHGQVIPGGKLVLPMIGSANRNPRHLTLPNRFDIRRNPNPHIAFGHGIHSCLGAALARMEARIALGDFLARTPQFELIEPWEPRRALHVHGPTNLKLRLGRSSGNHPNAQKIDGFERSTTCKEASLATGSASH